MSDRAGDEGGGCWGTRGNTKSKKGRKGGTKKRKVRIER